MCTSRLSLRPPSKNPFNSGLYTIGARTRLQSQWNPSNWGDSFGFGFYHLNPVLGNTLMSANFQLSLFFQAFYIIY